MSQVYDIFCANSLNEKEQTILEVEGQSLKSAILSSSLKVYVWKH